MKTSREIKFKPMDRLHVEWASNLFKTLNEGGAWGIPRVGIIFRKRNGRMVLTDLMPHHPDMPISEQELLRQQEIMYRDCKRHFEAAGIPVTTEVDLKGSKR